MPGWKLINMANLTRLSLMNVFRSILRHPYLFVVIILIQFAFLFGALLVQAVIQPQLLEAGTSMLDYMQAVEGGESSSLFGDDPLLLYRNWQFMVFLLLADILAMMILFLVFDNLMWSLSHSMVQEGKGKAKQFFIRLWRYAVAFIVVALPGGLLSFGIIRWIIFPAETGTLLFVIGMFLLIVVILTSLFLLTSMMASLHLPLRTILTSQFMLCLKKSHILFSLFFLTWALNVVGFALVFFVSERSLWLLLMASLLFVFQLVFGRLIAITIVATVEKTQDIPRVKRK